jgi:hypothetical protein
MIFSHYSTAKLPEISSNNGIDLFKAKSRKNTTLLLRIVCWLVCVSVYQAHVQQVLRTLPAQFIAPQLLRGMPAS